MKEFENKESKEESIITPKTIAKFTEFMLILKRIHIRLIAEGYTIRDGEIIPPKIYTEEAIPPKVSRRSRKYRMIE